MRSLSLLLSAFSALSLFATVFADDCQPWTWNPMKRSVGMIVCRYNTTTPATVNYFTCKSLADRYWIPVEEFFFLNPQLDKNCSNIKPNTDYCASGFEQPLVAIDGKCGLPNQNATCIGTDKQCCNSETWKCGDTADDCRPGTCFSGACPGADKYAMDGKCGPKNGGLLCGGKWGDCCNFDGVCGTGPNFCGKGKCESGNCTTPVSELPPPSTGLPWQTGTTPDGSCGGKENYTCDLVFGACCSPKGACGSNTDDCGKGCQTKYGKCSNGTAIVFFPDYGKFK